MCHFSHSQRRTATGPRQDSAQWDLLGRLTNATNGLGAFTFGYDGNSGRVVNADAVLAEASAALRTSFTYEGAGTGRRLTGLIHQKADAAGVAAGTPDWGTLAQHTYTYDTLGRLSTWQQWAGAAQKTWALTNDGDDQLTGVNEDGSDAFAYAYDAAGNRIAATAAGVPRAWTANGLNQLTGKTNGAQFSYDPEGNLLADSTRAYQWDAESRLVGISGAFGTVTWEYDAFNRRVRQHDTAPGDAEKVRDLIWEGLSLIESRDQSTGEVRRYYGNGESRTTTLPSTGSGSGDNSQPSTLNLLYLTDHLGSIRQLVDGDGNIRASYDYSPEGQRTKVSGDLDADFGFTGHYTHEGTGLVIAPYRFYDPATQRWLSRDPIEEEGGINLYGYVENGPTSAVDPLGLDVQGHHPVPFGDNSRYGPEFNFKLHPLVKLSGENLYTCQQLQYLENHGGAHSKDYLDDVKRRLDAGWKRSDKTTPGSAKRILKEVEIGIKGDIEKGTCRPYLSKEVKPALPPIKIRPPSPKTSPRAPRARGFSWPFFLNWEYQYEMQEQRARERRREIDSMT